MFDFAWTEIALIGVVALVAIGPKDLPVAIKAVAEMIKKARRMAGEFQTHVDEMVREANLNDVRDQFNDLRRMDIKGKILEAVDSDRSIRNTIAENPLDIKPAPPPVPVPDAAPAEITAAPIGSFDLAAVPGLGETLIDERPTVVIGDPVIEEPPNRLPAFIPPSVAAEGLPRDKPPPPAFVPPAAVAQAKRPADSRQYAHP